MLQHIIQYNTIQYNHYLLPTDSNIAFFPSEIFFRMNVTDIRHCEQMLCISITFTDTDNRLPEFFFLINVVAFRTVSRASDQTPSNSPAPSTSYETVEVGF